MVNYIGSRSDGYTPLMLACLMDRTECVKLLISAEAALDTTTEIYHITPLMLACSSGSVTTVTELLSHFYPPQELNLIKHPSIQACLEKNTVNLMTCIPHACNIDGKQALGKQK
jgi:ankyrin repeat protein